MLTINDVTSLSSRLACVLGLLVLPIVGCSDLEGDGGTGGTAATGGSAGAAGGGAMGGSGGGTVSLFTRVIESRPVQPDGTVVLGDLSTPVSGVKVCQLDTTNCGTTNAQGKLVLELPSNQEVAVSYEKEGYGSTIFATETDDMFREVQDFDLTPDEQWAALAEQLGVAYPFTGVALARVPTDPLAGVTFELVGTTAEAFYFDAETMRYTFDLEASTAFLQGYDFPLAWGGFLELSSGEHEIVYGGTAGDCTEPSLAWPGNMPNSIRLPVREGFRTYGSIICDGD
ncbi:MAG: hypothetical protein WBM46_08715 [Polyangiales bacterium]